MLYGQRAKFYNDLLSIDEYGSAASRLVFYRTQNSMVLTGEMNGNAVLQKKRHSHFFPFYYSQVYNKRPSFDALLFVLSQEEKMLSHLRVLFFYWNNKMSLLFFFFFHLSTTAFHIL